MEQKTFHRQSGKFLSVIAENMPEIPADIMQGWIQNPKALQKALLEALMPKGIILKLISTGENLKLDACDGKQTIYNSKDVFVWKDDDFKNLKINTTGSATPETSINVYELVQNATLAQMFGSVGTDLNKLCLTQSQILNFIVKHENCIRTEGYGTFFLFKSGINFFVAGVCVNSDGLVVHVYRLEYDNVCCAEHRHRLVIPQLIS